MMATLERWSSLGMRSRFSSNARVAVATMPDIHERSRLLPFFGLFHYKERLLTGLNSTMADVNQEHINRRWRRSEHVFRRRYKVNNRVVELSASPAVSRLISHLVPVEQLGNLVRHRAHAASPAIRE